MKFIPEGATLEDLAKELDRLYRRIVQLEQERSIVLPTSAPRDPSVGQSWLDIEGGNIQTFNGSAWDTYTKD